MDILKRLREQKGVSQRDIADYINKSPQAYSLYEVGKRDLDTGTLKKLADYFGVTTDYILGRNESHHETHPIKNPQGLSPDRERFLRELANTDDETAKELQSYLNYLKSKKEQAAMSTAT